MKRIQINKIHSLLLCILLLLVFMMAQQIVYSCDTVRAAGAATEDGSILLGANPDGPTNFGMVPRYIPREKHSPGEMRKVSSGDEIPEVEETYAFVGMAYVTGKYGLCPAESYKYSFWGGINEYGISMGLIGMGHIKGESFNIEGAARMTPYDIVPLLLQRSKTALEAVQLYGEFVEKYNAGGIGWPGGVAHIISGPDEAYLIEANITDHIWAARPIEEDVFGLSNSPQLGNSFTMSSKDAQKIENHYWTFEPRLTSSRALAMRSTLQAAYGYVNSELLMRVMSSYRGDKLIPEIDPSLMTPTHGLCVNFGWLTIASMVSQYKPDYPDLLRSRAYICIQMPGVGQAEGHVYLPFYVSAKKKGIPAITSNLDKMQQFLQVIPGREILKYQKRVFTAQEKMEEHVIKLINEGKEHEALTLIDKFEKEMIDDALALYERYYKQVVPLRINCGGPKYIDSLGNVWMADQKADTDNKSYPTVRFSYTAGTALFTGAPIANTDNDMCYQTARIGNNFDYNIFLPEGNYKVTLKFAEISPECKENGARVFNVSVNRMGEKFIAKGFTVISDLDIYAETKGLNKAVDKEFTVPIDRLQEPWAKPMLGGLVLKISFAGQEQNALLSGIEILKVEE